MAPSPLYCMRTHVLFTSSFCSIYDRIYTLNLFLISVKIDWLYIASVILVFNTSFGRIECNFQTGDDQEGQKAPLKKAVKTYRVVSKGLAEFLFFFLASCKRKWRKLRDSQTCRGNKEWKKKAATKIKVFT